ncbi:MULTISPECIES: H(+)/Cl(-) exchange transporter ClcA [Aeromonas]|uniref:H(+)/Cl(-) exchange transporter ClcA n=1 Tax=Aeromonas TaxID=642 RepID=UPI001CCDAC4B|nr:MULTISPECIES: H(+)/Cl(-) exchange transporter ClcA [Aeromonas]MCS3461479.1 CIC family chloride channel protein [Aeromonas sp. BIGb0445]UBO74772.1 H(+)/Cl(-) exchange transporter ClcA [Aeromonas rivuli]
MAQDTHSAAGSAGASSHSWMVRRLIQQDKMPLWVLLLAAVVGILAGLVCGLFESGVNWVVMQRGTFLADRPWWQLLFMGFGISALLGMVGYFLTHAFAPEAGGSGIPEIEGAMDDLRPVRWWRVLPVKFFGGICTLSSGMVLGREGPSVQIGGNLGKMVADIFRLPKEHGHALLAAGAAGGLAAAFNAPLAGILFVMEEMRPQFRYSFLAIKAVSISAVMATLTLQNMKGQHPVIALPHYDAPDLKALWLFLFMGAAFGVLGFVFNKLVLACQDGYLALHQNKRHRFVAIGMLVAGTFGVLAIFVPSVTGGGTELIPHLLSGDYAMATLFLIFSVRLVATLICFCSGAPGGVFAPTLALGTLFGLVFGYIFHAAFPELGIEPGAFAIAGMGALFAATVRAPVTGIVLVTEMTDNYQLILPMMITTIGATIVAQWLGGRPIYSQILERTLRLAARQRRGENSAAA